MKFKIAINNRRTGKLIFEFESEDNTVSKTLQEAVKRGTNLEDADLEGANFRYANLEGVNFRYANLEGVNFRYANLEGANLEGVNFRYANLEGVNFRDANLEGANFRYANLEGANLEGANFRDANLEGANLEGANLEGVNFRGANLEPIKNDLFIVLLYGLAEIKYLKENLLSGNINGSCYEGACSCLSGTLERGARISNGPTEQLKVDSILAVRNSSRPIERLFLNISKGDTKESNQVVGLVLTWIEEFEQLLSR